MASRSQVRQRTPSIIPPGTRVQGVAGPQVKNDPLSPANSGQGPSVSDILPGGGVFTTIGDSINSTADFLKLIAWLFHPRNILRGVEFMVGFLLMIFGLHAALTRSELGRVATELGRSARGGGRPRRPASAPHVTRRRALAQRYTREERVRERERKSEKPAGHSKRTKGSGAGTRKAPR